MSRCGGVSTVHVPIPIDTDDEAENQIVDGCAHLPNALLPGIKTSVYDTLNLLLHSHSQDHSTRDSQGARPAHHANMLHTTQGHVPICRHLNAGTHSTPPLAVPCMLQASQLGLTAACCPPASVGSQQRQGPTLHDATKIQDLELVHQAHLLIK